MTNREAIERGMAAIEGGGVITVNKTGTKAKADSPVGDPSTEGGADLDAEAWNMLRHLSRIL